MIGTLDRTVRYEHFQSILKNFHHLSVDVHNPDVTVTVEVRDFGAYIHTDAENGAGGMPYGSSGKACLLLSGGIDSPVAGYMTCKRGMKLDCLHFHSFPYTGEAAKEKVIELRNNGLSLAAIAKELNISKSRVFQLCN